VIDQNVEKFLEHHGVKGMKWGVRNQRSNISTRKKERRKAATDSTKRIAIGTAIGVGTLATIAAGAAFAKFLMNKKLNNTPVVNIRKTNYIEKAKKGAEIAKLLTSFNYVEEKGVPKHSERWKKKQTERLREQNRKFWESRGDK
jgi:hypothetical protein